MLARLLFVLAMVILAPAMFPASISEIEEIRSKDRFAPSATLAAVEEETWSNLDLLATIETDSEQRLGLADEPLFLDGPVAQAPPGGGETIPEPSTLVLIGAGLIIGCAREAWRRRKLHQPV